MTAPGVHEAEAEEAKWASQPAAHGRLSCRLLHVAPRAYLVEQFDRLPHARPSAHEVRAEPSRIVAASTSFSDFFLFALSTSSFSTAMRWPSMTTPFSAAIAASAEAGKKAHRASACASRGTPETRGANSHNKNRHNNATTAGFGDATSMRRGDLRS